MPLRRRALFRLALLGLVLAVIGGLVGAVEWRLRHVERSNGMWLPWGEPGRRYALLPAPGRINSQGFNEREIPLEKAPGVWRVVLVGDSVSFGGGLPREAVYTRVAERVLQERGLEVEIINLAIYGYDAQQVAATLHHRGWAYAPDLVVYAAYTNDGSPTALIQVGEQRAPVYVGDHPAGLWPGPGLGDTLIRSSAIYRRYLGAREARRLEGGAPTDREAEWAFIDRWMGEMAADAEAHDTPLLVWALAPHVMAEPDPERCGGDNTGPAFCAEQLRTLAHVQQSARALGLPFATSLPWLRASGASGFFLEGKPEDVHHPNAEGSAVVGRGLAEVLLAWRGGTLDALEGQDLGAYRYREMRRPGREEGVRKGGKARRSPAPAE
ncbi:MAG: SGNH/GDSL hydrolase family protein [Alphaproteobacteria bacterium]|nr:SGNH/GDSL hydrolase family protein [Alphaproteobacteria bacterium]